MKKSETPFEDIYNYLNNNLTRDKMREVECSIIDNGESEAVYHAMMFDYQHNRDYIESLIGTDDEENLDKTCQNIGNLTLKEKQEETSNKLKSNLVMENLEGLNLPKNMSIVQEAIKELQPVIEEMLIANEPNCIAHAKKLLMERYAMDDEIAQNVVDDLLWGINQFDTQFDVLKNDDQSAIRTNIENLLENKSEEEKKNLLINSLTALEALKEEEITDEYIRNKTEEYSDKSIEELMLDFERAMTEENNFDAIVNSIAEKMEILDEEQLNDLRKQLTCNTLDNKFYTALALYIAQCDGKIDLSIDEKGVDAKTIGAGAAAAVAMNYTTAQFQNNEIDRPTWMKWMKIIFGGLFFVLMVIAVAMLVTSVSIFVVLSLMSMFGQGVIATFVALGITFVVGKYLADKAVEFTLWLLDVIEEPYDKVVCKIASFINLIINKVKSAIQKEVVTESSIKEEPSQRSDEESRIIEDEQRGRNRGFQTESVFN